MDRTSAMVLAISIVAALFFASASCNAFIGAGIDVANDLSHTINFDLGKDITIGDSAFALAGMDVTVTWGANYDLAALAGYPYGYGGVGSVTQGGMGYDIGISVDAMNGAGFNGADWGVPMTEQGITATHYAEGVAEQAVIDDTQVALPFA